MERWLKRLVFAPKPLKPTTKQHSKKKNNHAVDGYSYNFNTVQIKKAFKFLYTNCDSLLNKREEIIARIKETNPDIILLSEMLPKHVQFEIQPEEFNLEGFQLF